MGRPSFGLGRLAPRLQLFFGAEASVGKAALEQVGAGSCISIDALRLAVRGVRTADVRAFVPIQSQPAKIVEDHLL